MSALEALLTEWDAMSKGETGTTKAVRDAIAHDGWGAGPGWTPGVWAEWSDDLAALIPEEDVGLHANPDAAQESIICDVLKGYAHGIHAVLQLHRPSEDHPADKDPYCIGCWEAGGMDGAPSWPCPTVQALGVLG